MAASSETRSQSAQRDLWRFADCEFDDLRFELKVHGQAVELERKPLEVLRYLLSRSGEVVRKEELLEAVWPGVLVVDASLATAVSKLRKVLGEQDVIQTVSRVGYRIAVPVSRLPYPVRTVDDLPDSTELPSSDLPPQPQSRLLWNWSGRRWLWTSLASGLVLAATIGLVAGRRNTPTTPQPVNVAILPFQNVSGTGSLDYLRSALPDEIAHTLSAARSLTVRPLAVRPNSLIRALTSAKSVMTSR